MIAFDLCRIRKLEDEARPGSAAGQNMASGQQPSANGGGGEFSFPRIELEEGRHHGGGQFKGGKKPSKEQLLKQAEAKQREMAGAPAEDKVIALMTIRIMSVT